jgi:hypothetical protein
MSLAIPNEWQFTPPEAFVAGDGPYAAALATVLGAKAISLDHLASGPGSTDHGGYLQVFDKLARVFLVIPEQMSAAEAIQFHQSVWDWIGKLASAGDQHELAFVFVLPVDASKRFEAALAAGLGLPRIDPASTGHAAWRRSGSLTELLSLLASIQPMDLVPIRARRAADAMHASLAKLHAAAAISDGNALREAARDVVAAFSGSEYLLDVFCTPPSHQHGNLLRSWLKTVVTESVNPQEWMDGMKKLAGWLSPDRAERPQ